MIRYSRSTSLGRVVKMAGTTYVILGCATALYASQFFPELNSNIVAILSLAMVVVGLCAPYLYRSLPARPAYLDEEERQVQNSIQAAERRMATMIDGRLKAVSREKIDVNPTITKLLNERLDAGLLAGVDEALKSRVQTEARTIRVLDFMNDVTLELKTRLEGPGARAESSASWARRAAYTMALVGLFVGAFRIYLLANSGPSLLELFSLTYDRSIVTILAARAAPWVGFVLLAEFTALLFLRFSNQAIALQRYFTEGLAQLRDRHLAMRFIIEYGTPAQVVDAAHKMIEASNRELKFLDDAKSDSSLLTKAADALKIGQPSRRAIKRNAAKDQSDH